MKPRITTADNVGQELAKRPTEKNISQLILEQRAQIELALPRHMSADRLARIAITAIRKTPKLRECTTVSLLGAVIQSAQLGLEPDGMLGQAYMIPFKREAQLLIGYRGMIDLARRSGRVRSISARVVHDGDRFFYQYGIDERLDHIPSATATQEVTHIYAVAQLVDGGHAFEVMSRAEIERVRSCSRAANDGPWVTHWEEMAKKTAIRRLFKFLPISVEMLRATQLDEMGEAGVPQDLGALVVETETKETEQDPDAPIPYTVVEQAVENQASGIVDPDEMGDPSRLTEEELAELEAAKKRSKNI